MSAAHLLFAVVGRGPIASSVNICTLASGSLMIYATLEQATAAGRRYAKRHGTKAQFVQLRVFPYSLEDENHEQLWDDYRHTEIDA